MPSAGERECFGLPTRATASATRSVVAIGDPPARAIVIGFEVDGCPYVLWLPGTAYDDDGELLHTGYTLEEALAYAHRF